MEEIQELVPVAVALFSAFTAFAVVILGFAAAKKLLKLGDFGDDGNLSSFNPHYGPYGPDPSDVNDHRNYDGPEVRDSWAASGMPDGVGGSGSLTSGSDPWESWSCYKCGSSMSSDHSGAPYCVSCENEEFKKQN